MFCPECGSEYRPGITRCSPCAVDLVAEPAPQRPAAAPRLEEDAGAALEDYCGFLTLEDARDAKSLLRSHGIGAEIVIRDASRGASAQGAGEEYWLRVPARSAFEVTEILGRDPVGALEQVEPRTFACSECREPVAEEETFCPHCGARFDE